jgi:Mn2+/Fe2+ NRAMP family transporter
MNDHTFRDKEILATAQERGPISTLGAYLRLSGPGWLQSAITLGGGSLLGGLYLGMAGGYSLLWVQLLAIFCGVVMLSAISYVTLSTGMRPYAAMNQYVNPVLGTAWLTATILANMIFILPQFSLAYDALETNLLPGTVDGTPDSKWIVSSILAVVAFAIVYLSFRPGWMHKLFDWLLKLIVAAIVVCFVASVVQLFLQGAISWEVFKGFIPDFSQLTSPAPVLSEVVASEAVSEASQGFWSEQLVKYKQEKMIAVAAAAVGINMTFLLPYSMLARGWDKTFRGLARWDLITGMAIPFVIVTSCIVITTAYGFHGQADEKLLDSDAAVVVESPFFSTVAKGVEKRMAEVGTEDEKLAIKSFDLEPEETRAATKKEYMAKVISRMSEEERVLACALAKPNSDQLAKSLEPLLGEQNSKLVFGIGAFAMAFSTIVVLMMINGFAFGEIFGNYQHVGWRVLGSLAAVAVGLCWVILWEGESKTYLGIVAGTFAILLLPIAYLAFLLMMNNRDLMQEEKPRGLKMLIWNVLMVFSLIIVSVAAYTSLANKLSQSTGPLVLGGVVTFALLTLIGFSAKTNDTSMYE